MAKHPKIKITIEPASDLKPNIMTAAFAFMHADLEYRATQDVLIKPLTTKQYEQEPGELRSELEASYAYATNSMNRRAMAEALGELYLKAIDTWDALHDPNLPAACGEGH